MGDNNTQGQILVKVSVNSAEALTNLKSFVSQTDSTMKVLKVTSAGLTVDGLTSSVRNAHAEAFQLRNAFEAVSHSVRAANGSVSQMLFALGDSMRLAGSRGIALGGVLTELATFLPLVGTAVLGAVALHEILSRPLPMEDFLSKQNEQLKQQVKLINELRELKEGGLLTDEQFARFSMDPSSGNLSRLMEKGLIVPGKSGPEVSETAKAQAEVNKLMASLSETDDVGGKKIQDLQEKFNLLKDKIQAAAVVLLNNNKITLTQYDEMIKKVDDVSDAEVDRLVRNLNFENQQKQHQQAEEAYQKGQVYFAKIVEEQKSELEKKLTDETANWVGNRLELADHEYNERMTLAMSMLYAGEATEKQYTDYVQFATNERDKMRAEENRKTLDRLQEQRKQELHAIEQSIKQDWTQTDAQKYDQLKAGGFQDKQTAGPNPNSFQDQFLSQMVQIQNQWGTMSQQMGKIFSSNLTTAINATSQAFTKLIMGTMTWKQALQSIESSILNELINAIIKMFEQWIIGLILQYTVGKALAAANMAANAGIAAGESAIWATPATLATIASYGGAAYSAPGIISAATLETMASVAGRQYGGPVRAGEVYEIGENRQSEFFVPEQNGYVSPYQPKTSTATNQQDANGSSPMVMHVHSWPDEQAAIKYQRDNPVSTHIMLGKVKRYGKEFRPK